MSQDKDKEMQTVEREIKDASKVIDSVVANRKRTVGSVSGQGPVGTSRGEQVAAGEDATERCAKKVKLAADGVETVINNVHTTQKQETPRPK